MDVFQASLRQRGASGAGSRVPREALTHLTTCPVTYRNQGIKEGRVAQQEN